ncbi:PAP2-domain-containing protein [Gloeophyllum trabeum ATCC 11539]|uniref:PAP2-domain-containing protein n=1 Tax=Gloeophyllum trabeum (strain ATCC 11539 / FP-39264 / Madison 617) TaxID=670483 RepID=S7QG73_GLOTA|nr:PAP2-domain-containing protein [Gloeophyllum trabeum ATCC 11539]EPQ58178.1 PAP2-domain-containing protein [Gloeophyllum trabeum ATCC 11539]
MNLFRRNSGRSRTDRSRLKQLAASYGPDWAVTIVVAAIFFAIDNVEGFRREFSLSDTSLRHPYAVHERVPPFALYMIAIVSPIVLVLAINLLTVRSFWDAHNSLLGLVLGLAITGTITQFTKLTVGRPRPDVIDRCQPVPGSADPIYKLSNSSICTQTDAYILKDGFRSFPSGHSSLSFAGLGFLSFYIAGKLHLFDKRGHAPKAWISLAPLAGAAMVAISRTMDYRHHWQDVLVGSILGLVMSYFSYRQYYPPLSSEFSHRPYSPRIQREGDVLPLHGGGGLPSLPPQNEPPSSYNDLEEGAVNAGTVPKIEPGPLPEIWKAGNDGGHDAHYSTLGHERTSSE